MKTSSTEFAPSTDTYITTLFLDRDEDGNFLDVDSMLYHSAEYGFYLARTIIQIWQGRTWETATDDEAESAPREHRRSLKVFRRLTPSQVIRLIVEKTIPVEEGALLLALNALDAAEIR
jgi:hypothetical protein